jgi:hypothetical protein
MSCAALRCWVARRLAAVRCTLYAYWLAQQLHVASCRAYLQVHVSGLHGCPEPCKARWPAVPAPALHVGLARHAYPGVALSSLRGAFSGRPIEKLPMP